MACVSVIIPTYNRASYIRATLDSVLTQTWRDFEIIVVDDGSTDDTEAVVRDYAGSVRYYRQRHSGRPAVGRNTGLQMAAGEYVAFLDSDDLFQPERLASHVQRLKAEPELALVYSDFEYFADGGGTPYRPPDDPAWRPGPHQIAEGHIFLPLLISNFLSICSVTLRRSILDEVGSFDEAPVLAGVEDYDLWLRIAARFWIGYVPGALSRVRLHGQNISGGDKLAQYLGTLAVLERIERLCPAMVARYRRRWQERRSLMHAAAAKAYARRGEVGRSLAHGLAVWTANPELRWLAYLVTTRRPAQQWLEQAMAAALSSGETGDPEGTGARCASSS